MNDLELLKRYLQNEIDSGSHKLFVFDKDYNAIEFKIVNALSEIEFIEKENQQLKEKLNCKEYFSSTMPEDTEFVILTKNNYDRQQKDLALENIQLKKQKDDVVDWIKNNYCYVGKKMSLKPYSDLKEILRMLGEIDE